MDACFAVQFDGAGFRCVMDGVAGARDDLSSSPSVDIANGTPDGRGRDTIYDTWVDGRTGSAGPPVDNTTQLRLSFSTNGGDSFTPPTVVPVAAGDRPVYAAIAVSPDGEDLYLVYNAFTTPYRNNTTDPRGLVGVVLHSETTATGAPGAWTEVHRGAPAGDPRASAQNNIVLEFIGDYVYADAMNEYGVAVWNDARQAAPCDDVNEWRQDVQDAGPRLAEELLAARPEIEQVCPAFGNTDIWAWSGSDPTP